VIYFVAVWYVPTEVGMYQYNSLQYNYYNSFCMIIKRWPAKGQEQLGNSSH